VILLGSLFIIGGGALSLLTWRHDLKRFRIGAHMPQAAPSRIPPEVHVLGGFLSAVGATILWSSTIGVLVLIAQPVFAYAVVRPLIERLT